MPFIKEDEYATREFHKLNHAVTRLAKKAGHESRLMFLHPTENTVRYASYLQDQKLPTKGQLAFERVKSSGNLLNYALYTFTDIYFKHHDPNELCGLWDNFLSRSQLPSSRQNEVRLFRAWKTNLLKTKYELLRKTLQCIDQTIRVQYVRYVNSILALGFVSYRESMINDQLKQDKKINNDAFIINNHNNYTETHSSTSAYVLVKDKIRDVEMKMRDKIIALDDVVVAVDTCTGTLWCEPLNSLMSSEKEKCCYKTCIFSEPGHHNPTKGYTVDSICAKIDPQIIETLQFYDIFKRATVHASRPCRAILTRSCDEETALFKSSSASSLNKLPNEVTIAGSGDDDETGNKVLTGFLLDLHNNDSLMEEKNVDKIVAKLVNGNYAKDAFAKSGTCAIKKGQDLETISQQQGILEMLDVLPGQDIVHKTQQRFSAAMLQDTSSATTKSRYKTRLAVEKTLVGELKKHLKSVSGKNKTYVKCIRALAALNHRTAASKRKLEHQTFTMRTKLCQTNKRLKTLIRDEQQARKHDAEHWWNVFSPSSVTLLQETTSDSDEENYNDTDVDDERDVFFTPEGYKVASAALTPHPPDYLAMRKILEEYWMSILRDCWGYEPHINPTGEKIDEKPSANTEDVLYKPFLHLMGLTTYFTIMPTDSSKRPPPLALMEERELFDNIFEQSLCGQMLKIREDELTSAAEELKIT